MADETTRTDDRRAWTGDLDRDTLRETDGHGTKENKVGVCMMVKEGRAQSTRSKIGGEQ